MKYCNVFSSAEVIIEKHKKKKHNTFGVMLSGVMVDPIIQPSLGTTFQMTKAAGKISTFLWMDSCDSLTYIVFFHSSLLLDILFQLSSHFILMYNKRLLYSIPWPPTYVTFKASQS